MMRSGYRSVVIIYSPRQPGNPHRFKVLNPLETHLCVIKRDYRDREGDRKEDGGEKRERE